MSVTRCIWRRVAVLLVVVAALPSARVVRTQEVAGPALKAAFLFNFVKFTTWPPDALPDAAPLFMCVVNDPAIVSSLTSVVRGRAVLGHEIRVLQGGALTELRTCHLLYVSGTRADALRAVAAVRQSPVFTVSDVQAFTTDGGIAQLHVQQGQLRFAIASDTARAARLQISSKLLTLARKP